MDITLGCALDVTRYKIKSLGKFPLSPSSGARDFVGGEWFSKWGQILEIKTGTMQGVSEPPQKLEVFENVILNEVIWCIIFIMLNI